MASSSRPSTKKTRKFRADVLVPAGVQFSTVDDTPDPSVQSLWHSLTNFNNVLPQSLVEVMDAYEIPQSAFSATSILDEESAVSLLDLSKRVERSAQIGEKNVYNEYTWKEQCYTEALSAFANPSLGTVSLVKEEEWRAVTIESGAMLFSNKPDYGVAYAVGDDDPLRRDVLDAAVLHGQDPFINDAKQFAFPLVAAEAKSNLGTSFEAENQCAEDAVKMLDKLCRLFGSTTSLPVFLLSLVGSNYAVYIATTGISRSKRIFRIQKMLTGNFDSVWSSLRFQIILWKLAEWIKGPCLTEIRKALEVYAENLNQPT